MKRHLSSLLWLLFLAALAAGVYGCATKDPDNVSVRPWNAPQAWENGVGSGMDTQHR